MRNLLLVALALAQVACGGGAAIGASPTSDATARSSPSALCAWLDTVSAVHLNLVDAVAAFEMGDLLTAKTSAVRASALLEAAQRSFAGSSGHDVPGSEGLSIFVLEAGIREAVLANLLASSDNATQLVPIKEALARADEGMGMVQDELVRVSPAWPESCSG
jgi:hypothetical protein